jgi:predicted DNA-binding protein
MKLQRNLDFYSDILNKLKDQNTNIGVVEDIMLEVTDSWGGKVSIGYELHNTTDEMFLEITTKDFMDYIGMTEDDFEDIDDDYQFSIDYISRIRRGEYKDLFLKLHYQYPSEINGWEPIEINDERKEVLQEVEERLKSLNCKIEYKYSKGIQKQIENGLWHLEVIIPVKLNISNKISKSDGVSNKFIKDFDSFIKDYKIDDKGVDRLSNIIRSFK